MAISETGLSVQTYEELLDDIEQSEQENVSDTIDIDEDTILGQLNMIFAAQLALANQGIQDVYDGRKISVAEGIVLDDAVSWRGITRQGAVATAGEQWFVGKDGTVLSANSLVQNASSKENYTLDEALTITKGSAKELTFSLINAIDATTYTVTVDGNPYTFLSVTADEQDILTGIVAAVTAGTGITCVDNTDLTATITADDPDDTMIISVDSNIKIEDVTTAGQVTGTSTGAIAATANSVTTILTPTSGWLSTYNNVALIIGRAEETDAELRERAVQLSSASGRATVDSIISAVLAIDGVSNVAVNEWYVSEGVPRPSNSQPLGSIQVVVTGGTDTNEIAQVIWDTKPAGVEIWSVSGGTQESEVVSDINGNDQTVKFNRPTAVPMEVTVNYTVFDTELYGITDIEAADAIKAVVVEFGNSYSSGENVVPKEFLTSIFCAVGGLERVVVTVNAVTAGAGVETSDTPYANPPAEYSIASNEESTFLEANVTVFNDT